MVKTDPSSELYYIKDNNNQFPPKVNANRRKYLQQLLDPNSKKHPMHKYRWNTEKHQWEQDWGETRRIPKPTPLTEREQNNIKVIDFRNRPIQYEEQHVEQWKVIPRSEKRKELILMAHKKLHHRRVKAIEKYLGRKYYWKAMREDVTAVLKTCLKCKRWGRGVKSTTKVTVPLKMHIAEQPRQDFYIDCSFMPPCTRHRYGLYF